MPSIVSNALAMLAARLLPPAFAFAVHVAVARVGGADTLGAYVNLLAVLMIFQAIAGAGMQFLVSRDIAAFPERASACARQARGFGLLTGVSGTALYVAYASWLLDADQLAPALVLATTIVPSAWIALHEAIFIATKTHHRIALVAVMENTIKMGVALGALLTGHGLLGVCVGIAFARLVGLATGAWLVQRTDAVDCWRMDFQSIAPFARTIAPFSALFICSMVYFRIDIPIVRALAGERATGLYGAAATLYGALLLLPESAMAAAYPRLARGFHAARDGYGRATWLLAKLLLVALVPVSIVLICCAGLIVTTVYGRAFSSSVPVLRLLALTLPIHALNGALGQALQAGGEQRSMVSIVLLGLVAHIGFNVLFVHAFGIIGAPCAMLVSSSIVATGALYVVHTRIAPLAWSVRWIPAALTVVGPMALVTFVPETWRPVAGGVALVWLIGGASYHRILALDDLEGMRAAMAARPAGAAA